MEDSKPTVVRSRVALIAAGGSLTLPAWESRYAVSVTVQAIGPAALSVTPFAAFESGNVLAVGGSVCRSEHQVGTAIRDAIVLVNLDSANAVAVAVSEYGCTCPLTSKR